MSLHTAEEDLCRKHLTIYSKEDLAFCRRQNRLHPPPFTPLANASTVAAHLPFLGLCSLCVSVRGKKSCSYLLYSRSMSEVFSLNGNAVD